MRYKVRSDTPPLTWEADRILKASYRYKEAAQNAAKILGAELSQTGTPRYSNIRIEPEGMKTKFITAVPAYGRDYSSKKAVLADWNTGKDFRIQNVGASGYVNKDDLPEGTVLNIRYNRMRYVVPVRREGEVK